MNAISTLRAKLSPLSRIEREAIAAASGVPFDTVQKIAIGATENPRYETAEKLIQYFKRSNKRRQKVAA